MTQSTYNRHRAFAGMLAVLITLSATNYYFSFGFFGRAAKAIVLVLVALLVIYGCFFSPTVEEMRQFKEAKRATKSGAI